MTEIVMEHFCQLPEVQNLLSLIEESDDEEERKEEHGEFMYKLHGFVEQMKQSLLQHDTVTKTVSVFHRHKADITLTSDLFTQLFKRHHFDDSIRDTVHRCIRKASQKLKLQKLRLDSIQLTGGSSLMPLFQQALLDGFNAGFHLSLSLSIFIRLLPLH